MKVKDLKGVMKEIALVISENKDYLVALDQQSGDGDLGISMNNGFSAAVDWIEKSEEEDIGLILNQCANCFNEAAPSSLGTILTFGMKGMAKKLKGKRSADVKDIVKAMEAGLENIMNKAGSKPGEKTVLDALYPAVLAMKKETRFTEAIRVGRKAAEQGCESTKNMKAVWGRAAYYGNNSIGLLDGGAAAGALIFKGIDSYMRKKEAGEYV